MKNSRSIASASSPRAALVGLCALVLALVVAWPSAAHAGRKRIVILELTGVKAEQFQKDLEKLLKKRHSLVSLQKWNDTADDLGAGKLTDANLKRIAGKISVDGVISGKSEKRGSRYYLHLQLRSGATGKIETKIDLVERSGALGPDGRGDIDSQFMPFIDDLPALGADEEDEDVEDAPPPSKGKGKPKGKTKPVVEEEDDEEDEDVRGSRPGWGRGKLRDRAAEDEDDIELEDDDPPPVAKGKGKTKPPPPAPKGKAKGKTKPVVIEDEEEDDDRSARGRDRDRGRGRDAIDEDEDEDGGRTRDRDRGRDDEDEDGDDRVGFRDDDDRDRDDRDDEDFDRDDRDRDRDDEAAVDPRAAIAIAAGLSFTGRSLSFTTNLAMNAPQGYSGSPVPGLRITADAYPLAMNKQNRSFTRNLGVQVLFDRALSISSQLQKDGMSYELPTVEQHLAFGVIYRHPFSAAFSLEGSLRYNKRKFIIDKSPAPAASDVDIPNTDYSYIDPGLGLSYQLDAKMALGAGARFLLITNTGEMQQEDQYGAATVTGVDLQANFDYKVAPKIVIRAAAGFATIGFAFKGNGELTNNRDGNADDTDVSGARDTYYGGSASAVYQF